MKPLILTMKSFGSYGQKTTIDFRQTQQNLFLVTGDTGSGKTTIFDAIVFALYGEASSNINRKDGIALQSQFAPLSEEPYVELTFSEWEGTQERIYTVRRIPRHERLLTRGVSKGKAVREVTGGVSLEMPDGTEYPSKETNRKLEEIVGLTKEQFMQVAMIAQGEFMDLLRAKSDEKKVIFRKLFHTELFSKIVDELGRRRKEKDDQLRLVKNECKVNCAHLQIPEDDEQAQFLQAGIKKIAEGDLSVMDEFLQALYILNSNIQKTEENQSHDLEELKNVFAHRRDAVIQAENLQKAYEQCSAAKEKILLYQGKLSEIESKEQEMHTLRHAYQCKDAYARYIDAKQAEEQCLARIEQNTRLLPTYIDTLHRMQEKASAAQQQYNEQTALFATCQESVNRAEVLFTQIDEAKKNLQLSQMSAQDCKNKLEQAQKYQQQIDNQEYHWRQELDQHQTIGEDLANVQHSLRLAKDWRNALSALRTLQTEGNAKASRYKANQKAYIDADNRYQQENSAYEQAWKAYMDDQAGVLAQNLAEGLPCPVCGSKHHPHPAETTHLNVLSKEKLDIWKTDIENLREKRNHLSAECKSDHAILQEKTNQYTDEKQKLLQKMQEYIDQISVGSTLDQVESVLSSWFSTMEKTCRQLEEKVSYLNHISDQLKALVQSKPSVQEKLQLLLDRSQKADNAQAAAKAALSELEKSKTYSSRESAESELKQAREALQGAQRVWLTAGEEEKAAAQTLHNCQSQLEQAENTKPDLERKRISLEQSYEKLLDDLNLTEVSWQDFTGRYPLHQADVFQQEIAQFHNDFSAEKARLQAAENLIGDNPEPDLTMLREKVNEMQEKLSALQKAHEETSHILISNQKTYELLTQSTKSRSELLVEYGRLNTLYRMLSGNVTDNRMDIETFVQRYYLERILRMANRRFTEMTAGQYELKLIDISDAGRGKNRGLDLMVYSTVTGKVREIRTLSGGESFMAALSLALGMADQITMQTSGIHLDMMFIDEGFGSLDDHSRDQAVRVLKEMAGDHRLIGIISHVTELKQQIDDQLMVRKDETGSHVRWQYS